MNHVMRNIAVVCGLTLGVATGMCRAMSNDHMPEVSSLVAGDYSREALERRLRAMPLQPVEGLWYFNEEQTTLLIERTDADASDERLTYRIVYVDSEAYDIEPGTVVGYVKPSAEHDKYALWIYSEMNLSGLERPVKCVATLSGKADVLTFEKTRWRLKFRANFARFLPSLFKGISLLTDYDEAEVPLGFRKVFPARDDDGTAGGVIRYL